MCLFPCSFLQTNISLANSNSYGAGKKTGGHATSWIPDSVGGMYPTR